jgi:transposase-like protein
VDASLARDIHRAVVEPNSSGEEGASLPKVIRNRFPVDFFEQVACVYIRLAAISSSPIVQLARANDVPPSTAHRWVKEARRLGLLGPREADRHGGREPSTPQEMLAFFGVAVSGSNEPRAGAVTP